MSVQNGSTQVCLDFLQMHDIGIFVMQIKQVALI